MQSICKLKVLLFSTGLEYGGAERQITQLACALKEKEWGIKVITLLPKGGFADQLEKRGIEVVSLEMRRGHASISHLIRAIIITREFSPQIIISFMFHANLLARLSGKLANTPAIITSIRTEIFGKKRRRYIEKTLQFTSDAVITNSSTVANKLVTSRVVGSDKIIVIPNGIDISKYENVSLGREGLRKKYGAEDDDFIWTAIGNLVEAKDYSNMLDAFRKVAADRKTRLLIAGQGDKHKELIDMIEELGLEKKVCLLGFIHEINELLYITDAFVSSSAWEGSPNAIIEAHAGGRPVVATDVGGVNEVVKDGYTGFLVEKRNPKALSEAMLKMMNLSSDERLRMGQAGKEYVEKHYGNERVIGLWEKTCIEIYEMKRRKC